MSRSKFKIIPTPLAEVVEDLSIYPRHAVDEAHVAQLVQAIEAGTTLPPPVICDQSKRIADGWHRIRAYRRALGPGAVIDMKHVHYESEADLVLESVALNSAHGRKLDRIDQTRCVLMLQHLGIREIQIAGALHVPVERLEKLSIKVATARCSGADSIPGTRQIALKRPVYHMRDTVLTAGQVQAHRMMPGTSFLLIARQLCTALREKMVNMQDDKLISQLRMLRDQLSASLA